MDLSWGSAPLKRLRTTGIEYRWKGIGSSWNFFYLGSMLTSVAKCHVEIKRRIVMGKGAFYKRT